jgi:hypothetical protein
MSSYACRIERVDASLLVCGKNVFPGWMLPPTDDRPPTACRPRPPKSHLAAVVTVGLVGTFAGSAQANVGSLRGGVCVVDVASDDVLWLRAKPNAKSIKVGSLPPDNCERQSTYAYFDGRRKGLWIQVRTVDGVVGWANERFLISFPAWDAST